MLAALLLTPSPTVMAQTLVVGRVDAPSILSEMAEKVLRDAFERAGLKLEMQPLPLLRSIEMANDGEIDGDLMRIADVARQYPNLVALDTAVNRVDVAVYGTSPATSGWSRADIEKMKVGITRGTFVLSEHTKGMDTTQAQSTLVLREMLRNGRFDAAILIYADTVAAADGATQGLVRWPYAWASEPLYFYLNRKHAALLPRLNEALLQMKKAGLIERHISETMRRHRLAPLPAEPRAAIK